jgi:hypothetical protein
MEQIYKDRGIVPGHGPFFKWNLDDDHSPQLALHDNIFKVDQPANGSSGLGLPEGKLAGCSNNIVVWLGEGQYPGSLPALFDGSPCFTITTNPYVWDQAVQTWLETHGHQGSETGK